MINPLIIIYLISLYSCLRGLCAPLEHEILKDELIQRRETVRGGGNGEHSEWKKKHPKAKRKQQKKETPCTKDIFISLCSVPRYCTFLQKPEKRTWLYSSLFLSSLETRMKPELVWGLSRTCRNERPVLLQEAGWCHQLQHRRYRNVSRR